MTSFAFCLFAILAVLSVAMGSFLREEKLSMTGDIFVFAYSWTPEFCYNQPTYASCNPPNSYWKTHFTIHGLWPQYSAGGYPHDCTNEAFNSSVPNQVGYNDMVTYWPNVQKASNAKDYDSFWDHEWTKHGTCTGLSQYNYFKNSLNLIQKFGTPSIVTNAVGKTLLASDLRNAFGGNTKVALLCNGGNYLVGAYTCWSQSKGVPSAQVVCPSDVQKEDTCTAQTLYVKSF